MRSHYLLLLFLLPLYFSCTPKIADKRKANKPNIIFIMSDDQGYHDLGAYGSEFVHTPFLDKMAKEGMKFTQVYAGAPVCAPTRCSLLTGKHTGHTTRRDNRSTDDIGKAFGQRKLIPLGKDDYTFATMLKEAGYVTGGFGKWGLGNPGTTGTPDLHGFDEFFGYLDQVHAHDYYPSFLMHNLDTIAIPENEGSKRGIYTHDLIAEKSRSFIKENAENPFFLYLPFTPPHGKYEVPDNSLYVNQSWPEKVKNYAAMITRMDKDIGRMFDLLEELNLDENTIVFFTSDHGPNPPFLKDLKSNKPFRGIKRQVLEGGLRVPMIVRWPGTIPANRVSEFPWAFWDVMPTFAEIAGVKIPATTDGISVMPSLLGKDQQSDRHLYWEYYRPFQQAVRLGKWKGIRLGTEEPLHLFDLSSDEEEKHDLAKQHPDIVNRIEGIMAKEHIDSPYWPTVQKARKKAISTIFKTQK